MFRFKFSLYLESSHLKPFRKREKELSNSNFLIPISLQPDVSNLLYFKLRLFDLTEFYSLENLRSTILDRTNIRNRKSEFVAKTQFLPFYTLYSVHCEPK